MKHFAKLFDELDSTTSTNEKVTALQKYFSVAPPEDSMWAVLILTGRTTKKSITSRDLRVFFLQSTNYPEWLFEESYSHVGDTAETISLLLQSLDLTKSSADASRPEKTLTEWIEVEIPKLVKKDKNTERADALMKIWQELKPLEVFLLNKLMTGGFRVGVSEKIVIRALSEVFGVPTDQIAHRLTGAKTAGLEAFRALVSKEVTETPVSQPYPFCLAHSWNDRTDKDFNAEDWAFEWKYDGIRAQVIHRGGETWIWSRGEDEVTKTFPDIVELFKGLPRDVVMDGEILVRKDGKIMPFQELQKRLGRKKVSPATLKDQPAAFIAYDILEDNREDLRALPLRDRRARLEKFMEMHKTPRLSLSETLKVTSVEQIEQLREQSREMDAEGLMIKAWDSPYVVGRKTGAWWKHKVDPLTLDAVLIYAQAGTGRRANLYTDYTFALWSEIDGKKELVPFAKAYSGLDQNEIDELDSWIRRHTREKFGPVRSLEAHHVFEIAFEGIGKSTRHKSGIAVRFPRILRWRKDKPAAEADTLQSAVRLIEAVV
ncbi:MAG: ATP-dependent DNA ligase [Bdellovibrionaceae bacterium]|nr:ATP-dependent DNA ligase [Pseudobdellovibrionaceae bacterium]